MARPRRTKATGDPARVSDRDASESAARPAKGDAATVAAAPGDPAVAPPREDGEADLDAILNDEEDDFGFLPPRLPGSRCGGSSDASPSTSESEVDANLRRWAARRAREDGRDDAEEGDEGDSGDGGAARGGRGARPPKRRKRGGGGAGPRRGSGSGAEGAEGDGGGDGVDDEEEDGTDRSGSASPPSLLTAADVAGASSRPADADLVGLPTGGPTGLPSAAAVFGAVRGAPGFLRPKALAPLAGGAPALPRIGAGKDGAVGVAGAPSSSGVAFGSNGKKHVPGDISRLAPAAPGQKKAGGAVASAAAVAAAAGQAASAASPSPSQLAFFGIDVSKGGGAPGPAPQPAARNDIKSQGAKAMPVDAFLADPSAALPRKKGERKDKEKAKRTRGQSSVHGWKSEAEMVMRQQYD